MQHFKHLLNWHIISIEATMTFCFCSIYTGCNDVIKFDSISCHHVVGHACMHCDAKIIEVADRRRYIDKFTSLGIEKCPCEIPRTKWTFFFSCTTRMAGSSMRLLRLKPQGPGHDRGPGRPVQRKFTKYDHFGPWNLEKNAVLIWHCPRAMFMFV